MYSTALKHFKNDIEQYVDKEYTDEILKEEQEFAKYLAENPADVNRDNIEDISMNYKVMRGENTYHFHN